MRSLKFQPIFVFIFSVKVYCLKIKNRFPQDWLELWPVVFDKIDKYSTFKKIFSLKDKEIETWIEDLLVLL